MRAHSSRVLSAEHPTRQLLIDKRSRALSGETLGIEDNGLVVSRNAAVIEATERHYLLKARVILNRCEDMQNKLAVSQADLAKVFDVFEVPT